jgi:ribosome-associated translation inhibitor RaiA
MQIQVNHDSNIDGREEVIAYVSAEIESGLARFADQLTRIEVHLADESAGRTTGSDKRCLIEARPAKRSPVVASSHAPTVDEALGAAISKLSTLLDREFGRREHRKGAASIRNGRSDVETGETGEAEDSPGRHDTDASDPSMP